MQVSSACRAASRTMTPPVPLFRAWSFDCPPYLRRRTPRQTAHVHPLGGLLSPAFRGPGRASRPGSEQRRSLAAPGPTHANATWSACAFERINQPRHRRPHRLSETDVAVILYRRRASCASTWWIRSTYPALTPFHSPRWARTKTSMRRVWRTVPGYAPLPASNRSRTRPPRTTLAGGLRSRAVCADPHRTGPPALEVRSVEDIPTRVAESVFFRPFAGLPVRPHRLWSPVQPVHRHRPADREPVSPANRRRPERLRRPHPRRSHPVDPHRHADPRLYP